MLPVTAWRARPVRPKKSHCIIRIWQRATTAACSTSFLRRLRPRRMTRSTPCSFFYDEPQIGGASAARRPARSSPPSWKRCSPYLGVDPQYTESEYENLSATAPNVIGMTMAEAKSHLEEQGLQRHGCRRRRRRRARHVQVPSPVHLSRRKAWSRFTPKSRIPKRMWRYRDSSAMTSILAATWRVLPMSGARCGRR